MASSDLCTRDVEMNIRVLKGLAAARARKERKEAIGDTLSSAVCWQSVVCEKRKTQGLDELVYCPDSDSDENSDGH